MMSTDLNDFCESKQYYLDMLHWFSLSCGNQREDHLQCIDIKIQYHSNNIKKPLVAPTSHKVIGGESADKLSIKLFSDIVTACLDVTSV